ncbi:MAG: SLC13 family permease [Planctomycetota bacterium]|jgi:sodium-dependent dicarboxylate transporter 2/3/5
MARSNLEHVLEKKRASLRQEAGARSSLAAAFRFVGRDTGSQILIGLFAVSATVFFLPTPEGLTPEGQKALSIFVLCAGLWISHVIPLHITSILAILLISLLGIMDTKEAYALFGNEAIFFILGAFILAAILAQHGISSRLATFLLSTFGKSPVALRSTIYLFCAFMSFWMSEHAVAAMMYFIVFELATAQKLMPRRSNYGKTLFLAMCWGCVIGGIATFLGGARAPLAIAMLEEVKDVKMGFWQWMVADMPVVIIMLISGEIIFRIFFPCEIKDVSVAYDSLMQKRKAMGKLRPGAYVVTAIMVATIFCWIFFREQIGLANTALGAVVLLFVLRLVEWKQVEESVNWGIILMYGGAIALGSAMNSSGASLWLTDRLVANVTDHPLLLIAIIAFLSKFLTEVMSNTAVVAVLLPVCLNASDTYGVSPEVITFTVTLSAGLAFMLPMGSPATAIAYSSGFLSRGDFMKAGLCMNVIAWVVFILVARYYWPLLGYNITP